MAAKVTKVSEAAAAVKAKVEAVEKGGKALSPGYQPTEPPSERDLREEEEEEDGVSTSEKGSSKRSGNDRWNVGALFKKRGGEKKSKGDEELGGVAARAQTPVWFDGLSALSHTDRRVVETTSGGLRRRFAAVMGEFYDLRVRIREDYKSTVARRYYAVTGREADDDELDRMADTGEGEEMLSHAVREAKGSGRKDSEGAAERGMVQVRLTLEEVRQGGF